MTPTIIDGIELAKRLDRRYSEVMTWARRGIIPSFKLGKRRVFNLEQVVEALMDHNEREEPTMVGSAV